MTAIERLNSIANPFGYTVVPTELWEQINNELVSLVDAIKVYERKDKQNERN